MAVRWTNGASVWRRVPANPAGAAVSRGGAANGPAAVYAIRKWDEWLRKYAPPGAASYDFYQSLPALSQGNVVVTEISGSESVIHMRAGEDTGVSLSHDIHPPYKLKAIEQWQRLPWIRFGTVTWITLNHRMTGR